MEAPARRWCEVVGYLALIVAGWVLLFSTLRDSATLPRALPYLVPTPGAVLSNLRDACLYRHNGRLSEEELMAPLVSAYQVDYDGG